MSDKNIISIIPARGGSKGVPGKNIRNLYGYPLIAYSITASKNSKKISRTIVSTDSEEIASIAKEFGAEVPFLRPPEISGDNSTDLELFNHIINWFENNEGILPQFMVHLRPTTPLRDPKKIDEAIELIKGNIQATALRSVHELAEPPHKVFQLDSCGMLKGFFPDDLRPEYYNLPRQLLPKAYHPNGYVDIIKTDLVKANHALHGNNILGFITPEVTEVDLPEHFDYLMYQLSRTSNPIYKFLSDNFPKKE